MNTLDIAVSAAVGSVVAVGTTVVLKLVTDAQSKFDRKVAEDLAYSRGRQHGYAEGQDSITSQLARDVSPQDFTSR